MTRFLWAVLLAAMVIGGCKSARDAHPSGDTYPQHERWWK